MVLDQNRCDGTDLFQILNLAEHSQFAASFRANSRGDAGPVKTCSGEEEVSDKVVEEADEEGWDLDVVMTAAGANKSSFRGKFYELQTKCQAENIDVLAGLIDVVRKAKPNITSEEQLRERD